MAISKEYIVYQALNKLNGKRYIGCTSKTLRERRRDHLSESRRNGKKKNGHKMGCRNFHNALRKYGENSFEWSVILVLDTLDAMLNKERELITIENPEYNIAKGGRGAPGMAGKTHSRKTKKRLRELGLQNKQEWLDKYQHLGPQSMRKQVVCLSTGKVYQSTVDASADTGADRAAIVEICLQYRGRKTANGLVFRYLGEYSEEEADKLLDEAYSCRHKRRVEKGTRKWPSAENKDVLKAKKFGAKQIICTTDGKRFHSLTAAARFYDADLSSISNVCRGKLSQHLGLRFKFLEGFEVHA